jgi:hypothetical protein
VSAGAEKIQRPPDSRIFGAWGGLSLSLRPSRERGKLRYQPPQPTTGATVFRPTSQDIISLRSAHAAPFGIFPRLAAYRVDDDGSGAKLIFEQDRRRRKAGT